jgi:hypothetical protein
MKALCVAINILAVIVAGGVGSMFRGKLKTRYQEILVWGVGVLAMVLAVFGMVQSWFVFEEGQMELPASMLVILYLAIGTVLGEALDMEAILNRIGRLFKKIANEEETDGKGKKGRKSTHGLGSRWSGRPAGKRARLSELPVYNLPSERSGHRFVDGFVVASLLVCMNALLWKGVVQNVELLYYKTAIDFVIVLALASVYGTGVSFAALPLALCEGGTAALSVVARDFFTDTMVRQLSVIGSAVVLLVGVNLAFQKKWKAANVVPALLLPVLYTWVNQVVAKLMETGS